MSSKRELYELQKRGENDALNAQARRLVDRGSSMVALNDIDLYGKICKDDEERRQISEQRREK